MKRLYVCAALALGIGAFGCERKSEPAPSETTTTSGTMGEEQEHTDTSGARGIPSVRAGDTTGAEAAGGGADAVKAGDTVRGESSRARGDAGIASERRADDDVQPTAEKKSKGQGQRTGGASKAKGANESTTLGDRTSGQYTGGKGTDGGKATHGTGGDTDKE